MSDSKLVFNANKYPLEAGTRILEASAGTGKTFSLAHLVLRHITEAKCPIDQMLIISFTKATAAEIKSRINERLILALKALEPNTPNSQRPLSDATLIEWIDKKTTDKNNKNCWASLLLKALEDIDNADITTIHGFCSRTIKREAISLSSHTNPEALSDEENRDLILEILTDYWREEFLDLPPEQLKGLQKAGLSLDSLFKTVLKIDSDPSLTLKTYNPQINFNEPIKSQLDQWVKGYWERFVLHWRTDGLALDEAIKQLAKEWKALGVIDTKPFSPNPRRNRHEEISEWIDAFTSSMINLNINSIPSYNDIRSNLLLRDYFHPIKLSEVEKRNNLENSSLIFKALQQAIGDIWDKPAEMVWEHALSCSLIRLKEVKDERGVISHSDQLRALDPNQDTSSGGLGTHLRKKLRKKYKVILVDEFQDTDPIQWRIINTTFGKSNKHFLLMVGDPKQSIYRFRGGDLSTYLQAKKEADRIDSLTTNYRAAPELMMGLNSLLGSGLRNSSLDVPPLLAASKEKILKSSENKSPIDLINLKIKGSGSNSSKSILPSKSEVEKYIPNNVTNSILELVRNNKNEISLNDICVLVSRHEQAEVIRKSLSSANLTSRLVNKGDIFESQGAKSLQIFLDCLAQPTELNKILLLASSPLMQWDLDKIKLAEKGTEIEELIIKCIYWSKSLSRIGILGCLSELLESKFIAELSERGRLLGDLQQSAELVQEAIHNHGLDSKRAARWLRKQCLRTLIPVPDNRRPNSDIAEEAINITTIHRSKGLQYKVVICPYLWQAALPNQGPLWRTKDHRHWILSLTEDLSQKSNILEDSLNEAIAEAERLAYVAMTRAERKLIIFWCWASKQENNPIKDHLIPKNTSSSCYENMTADQMNESIKNQGKYIKVRTIKAERVTGSWQRPKEKYDLCIGPIPSRKLEQDFGRFSYSKWISKTNEQWESNQSPEAIEEGKDTYQEDSVLTQATNEKYKINYPKKDYDQSPLKEFPRGSLAGECLHRILERIDFTVKPSSLQTKNIIEDELKRSEIDLNMISNVQNFLERLTNVPLGNELNDLKLKQIKPQRRISELSFDVSLASKGKSIKATDIALAFEETSCSSFGRGYSKLLCKLEVESRGFLTGSIDLVFADKDDLSDAKWWIIDWKSNWIDAASTEKKDINCSPANYGNESMKQQMISHHYPLQAYIYLVALHRYLKWRLDKYEPRRHLGGYIYIFLRGLPKTEELYKYPKTSSTPGVFLEEASIERVLILDELIHKGGK